MKHRALRHFPLIVLVSVVAAALPRHAFGQDTLAKAKSSYESADYEAALNLLETLKGKPTNTEAAAYRVFCLVALGRTEDAKAAVVSIVKIDPLFRPSQDQVSPRLLTFFEDIRKPLLPDIARQTYASAKAAYDRKDWAPAVADFERVISLVQEIGSALEGSADLRTLAAGFRDLARAALEPPKPAAPPPAPVDPAPAATPSKVPAEPAIYSAEHANVKRPTPLTRKMPEWRPEGIENRMVFEGVVEVVVAENGTVLSARMIKNVHPRYDAELLKTAATWTFRPATKNGVAVKFRYTMAVSLGR